MLDRFEKYCGNLSMTRQILFGISMILIIGLLDLVTGTEISFSVFYLIPVVLISWCSGKTLAYLICVLSALVWFLVEYSTNYSYTQAWIPYWNAIVRLTFFLVIAQLLVQLKSYLEREEGLQRIDAVTGAKSGASFKEAFRLLFNIAVRHKQPTTLVRVGLNNFDYVIDTMGRTEGNRVLQTLVMAMTLSVRSTDVVGRISGDEFAIVFPHTSEADAKQVIDKLHVKLVGLLGDRGWPIGLTFAVVIFHDYPKNYWEALKHVDGLARRVSERDAGNVVYETYGVDQPVTDGGAAN